MRLIDKTDRRSTQRRQHPRATVPWPVTVLTEHDTLYGRVENISRGGILVRLDQNLEQGESARLAVEISDTTDIITSRGEVVRTFALKRGGEQDFSFGVALKYTEINEQNLKFFSGNLAPEWADDYQEIESGRKTSFVKTISKNYYILLGLLVVLFVPFFFVTVFPDKQNKNESALQPIEDRLTIIEKEVASSQDLDANIENINNEIGYMKNELSSIKTQLHSFNANIALLEKIASQNGEIVDRYKKNAASQSSLPGPHDTVQPIAESGYYTVKKGENLYRISLKTGITVEQLRKLNGLGPDTPVLVDQKLIIK